MDMHVQYVDTLRPEAILHQRLEVPMKGVSKQWMERFRSELRKIQKSTSKKTRRGKKMVQSRKRK